MEELSSVVPVEPVPAFTRKREDGEPDSSSMYFAIFMYTYNLVLAFTRCSASTHKGEDGGKNFSFAVIPDIVYRESILVSFRMDTRLKPRV